MARLNTDTDRVFLSMALSAMRGAPREGERRVLDSTSMSPAGRNRAMADVSGALQQTTGEKCGSEGPHDQDRSADVAERFEEARADVWMFLRLLVGKFDAGRQ